ncbi:hypothetical protein PCASD_26527, partial [Puccinia coronata f. sp. avenae]
MFWADAINTATQLSNLTPSSTRRMKIPYKIWTDPTAEKGIMVGYENDFSTYRVYKTDEQRIVQSCNIKFDEDSFPGLKDVREENPNQDIFETANHRSTSEETPTPVSESAISPSDHPPVDANSSSSASKAPKNISSQISQDNILSVDRRGNSIIVYLTKNVESNTPKTYIQAINSPDSSFWKKAIQKELSNMYDHDVWAI